MTQGGTDTGRSREQASQESQRDVQEQGTQASVDTLSPEDSAGQEKLEGSRQVHRQGATENQTGRSCGRKAGQSKIRLKVRI